MTTKPLTSEDYDAEDSRQVVAACLTFAGALGDMSDELCIIGGLVPSMICETVIDPSALNDGAHVGTTDLDVALEVSVLHAEHYKEISSRLRTKGFEPDRNEDDERTRQRWRWREQKVTIDFLMPPAPGVSPDKVRIQSLESDFAALIVKPLGLAFEERIWRNLKGENLEGDRVARRVAFCGPAAFVALKAFAFSKREESKDAYDLVYVLRRWPLGLADVAARMGEHARRDPSLVAEVLELFEREFGSEAFAGPRAAARFHDGRTDADRVADAHGAADDFLRDCARRGIEWRRPSPAIS